MVIIILLRLRGGQVSAARGKAPQPSHDELAAEGGGSLDRPPSGVCKQAGFKGLLGSLGDLALKEKKEIKNKKQNKQMPMFQNKQMMRG